MSIQSEYDGQFTTDWDLALADRTGRMKSSIIRELLKYTMLPDVIFAEGGYRTFLLKGDVVERWERFRRHGAVTVPTGPGLGVQVSADRLQRYTVGEPIVIRL